MLKFEDERKDQNEAYTSRDEERLRVVKMDATNRSLMLVKSIDQCTHAIIPELDHATVQTRENPWSLRVKAQTLNSVTLSLELRQHNLR